MQPKELISHLVPVTGWGRPTSTGGGGKFYQKIALRWLNEVAPTLLLKNLFTFVKMPRALRAQSRPHKYPVIQMEVYKKVEKM